MGNSTTKMLLSKITCTRTIENDRKFRTFIKTNMYFRENRAESLSKITYNDLYEIVMRMQMPSSNSQFIDELKRVMIIRSKSSPTIRIPLRETTIHYLNRSDDEGYVMTHCDDSRPTDHPCHRNGSSYEDQDSSNHDENV